MRYAALTAFLVVCCATAQAATTTPPAPPGALSSNDIAVSTSPAAAVGKELVRSFNQCDTEASAHLIDMHAFGLRIAQSIYAGTDQQNTMADQLGNASARAILKTNCRMLQDSHGTMRLMRITDGAGQSLVLVRFDQGNRGDGGFDYMEFTLKPNGSGQYRVVDWYQLSKGNMTSFGVGALMKLLTDPDPDFVHRFFGLTQFNSDVVDSLRRVGELQNQGKYAEALNELNQLPAELAENSDILRLRAINANRANNHAEYQRIVGLLAGKYGNDPSVAFMAMDYYVQTKQVDKLEESVALIEGRVGSDGFTNMWRANVCLRKGSYDQAVAYARKAIDLEPDMPAPWYSLTSAYVELKQYPQAVEALQTLQSRFGVKLSRERIVSNPKFAGFVQSDAFLKWMPQ